MGSRDTTQPVNPAAGQPDDINELMLRRREELSSLIAMGVNPYPYSYEVTDTAAAILAGFGAEPGGRSEEQAGQAPKDVRIAGRIMSLRRMGKASFCHVQDATGRIQAYLKKDDLGPA